MGEGVLEVIPDGYGFLRSADYNYLNSPPLWDKVLHSLKSQPVILENTDFSATVNCTLMVREADSPALCDLMTRITDGRAEMIMAEELYYPWEVE